MSQASHTRRPPRRAEGAATIPADMAAPKPKLILRLTTTAGVGMVWHSHDSLSQFRNSPMAMLWGFFVRTRIAPVLHGLPADFRLSGPGTFRHGWHFDILET